MRNFLAALLLASGLLALGTAQAQTVAPPVGVTVSTQGSAPVSAELNKYEIRRCLQIGVITREQAREIRARKREFERQQRSYQKAEAAKLQPAPRELSRR